ncbi:hypothetical protein TBLA_0A08990 [Henningerozyma blattae CBS 6284]|uniref:FYVE-type domain-containing protein n=1 Tax=Henningerozyma blattae (strain ATCC 34711 / CBS 6284 / DSM 70876 / NBRC 10599 / NRRL Y-10934 / UCD 77-7) TaxID=1071380 RepID=I2GX36_HENB6|nr:hypothetical protein TBLA_0A08990 [Tetrapisispora blattae CBS 6284]CCH58688.1 hypothetical protein TBLA_0A08990 [Tetrapisispora blattae CBS 6284]
MNLDKITEREKTENKDIITQETLLANGSTTNMTNYSVQPIINNSEDIGHKKSITSLSSETSTITFEKQKVTPKTALPHSLLSSSFMARDRLNQKNISANTNINSHFNNAISNESQQDTNKIYPTSSYSESLEASQQSRTPVVQSFKKNNSLQSESANLSNSINLTKPENSKFTDGNNLPKEQANLNASVHEINSKSESEILPNSSNSYYGRAHRNNDELDDETGEKITQQKELTAQALKRLSIFKGNNITGAFADMTTKNSKSTKSNTSLNSIHSNNDSTHYTSPLKLDKKSSNHNLRQQQSIQQHQIFRQSQLVQQPQRQSLQQMQQQTTSFKRPINATSNASDSSPLRNNNPRKNIFKTNFPENGIGLENSPTMMSISHTSTTRPQLDKLTVRGPSLRIGSSNSYSHSPLTMNRHGSGGPDDYNMGTPRNTFLKAQQKKKSTRQINNPKKPLYIPAVLRDISETNLTNEDLKNPPKLETALSNISDNSPIHASSMQDNQSSRASIHSTNSFVKDTLQKFMPSFFSSYNEGSDTDSTITSFETIKGNKSQIMIPKRSHWLPDQKRDGCHYCNKQFTFWERKHHCRHCGDIFCQQHLCHWLYLDEDAQFIIGGGGIGSLCKVCDNCLEIYEKLVIERSTFTTNARSRNTLGGSSSIINKIKQSNQESVVSNNTVTQQGIPNKKISRAIDSSYQGIDSQLSDGTGADTNEDRTALGSVVGSVPANWNWSSF